MSRKAAAKNDDGKKKKQQAASLARRMAGKKGQSAQLQVEVNNEEEWEKLISKEGLIVMDVYSDWSGPCVGMIGNLRRTKVEIGSDSLILAIVKNDEIECLQRFRDRSEPTWLFVAGGMLVNGMFGANAPRLTKMMDSEMKKEQRVMKGETWRQGTAFTELIEDEKERLRIAEKMKSEMEKLEAERKAKEADEKRNKLYTLMADQLTYETVVICFPHTLSNDSVCVMLPDLNVFFRNQLMFTVSQSKMVITKEIFDEVFYRGSLELTDDLLEDLKSGPCFVILVKSQVIVPAGQEGEKKPGDIEKIICGNLYNTRVEHDQEFVVPSPNSLPAKYPYIKKIKDENGEEEDEEGIEEETSIPGCWTPSTFLTKCAAVKYLFPARAEKVLPELTVPLRMVIAFDVTKQKECYDIIEEHPDDVLNVGYFSSHDAATAEPICATPEQYATVKHFDTDRLVIVVKAAKDEPLLSLAGLGAVFVSLDPTTGEKEADLFFPFGVEPKYARLEEAERLLLASAEVEEEQEYEEEAVFEEEEEEPEEQDEEDLMALLGVTG